MTDFPRRPVHAKKSDNRNRLHTCFICVDSLQRLAVNVVIIHQLGKKNIPTTLFFGVFIVIVLKWLSSLV